MSAIRENLWQLLNTLTPREVRVLTLRYGVFVKEPLRQHEVAHEIGRSAATVGRLEKLGIAKLRKSPRRHSVRELLGPNQEPMSAFEIQLIQAILWEPVYGQINQVSRYHIRDWFLQDQSRKKASYRDLARLVRAINEGLIVLEKIRYSPAKPRDVPLYSARGNENEDQEILRRNAAHWCWNEYGEWPLSEKSIDGERHATGERHDLVAVENRIIIECGSTKHFRLGFHGLEDPEYCRAFVLFPRMPEYTLVPEYTLFRFTASEIGKSRLTETEMWFEGVD